MPENIPCIFHESICPRNCPAHNINEKNLKQISQEIGRGITYRALLSLLTDPDREIGTTLNTLRRKAHWTEEQLEKQRANMYNLRADVNARRQQMLSEQKPYCQLNK